jgi:preprotein translocase subunit SecA
MFKFIKRYFDQNIRALEEAQPIVTKILALEEQVKLMSLEEMRAKVDALREDLKPLIDKIPEENRMPLKPISFRDNKEELAIHSKLQENLPEIFAYLREINNRKFNKKHFPVQLLAATILAQGNKLTELKTGEGKTQVFHLPAALYGITGRGAHVITVNDYLARRDGEHAGHAVSDLGITVGIITPQSSYRFVRDEDLAIVKGEDAAEERKKINVGSMSDMHGVNLVECSKQDAYAQDIVYGTNNEFGFDYLRDNMVFHVKERVQKELYYCIIDEADSILIDEARTPLIISAPAEASNQLYDQFARIVEKLEPVKHYVVDEKERSSTLTEEGVEHVEKLLGVKNIWEDYRFAHHLDNALKALALFKNNDHYLVKDGEILIVDEFTGRILPGRRYSEGLHQAIEAKERVEIKKESKTLATITFQNFFKLYKIIGGGSGTILTEAEEFQKIYALDSYVVPTNVTVVRKDATDKVFKDRKVKFESVANEIIEIHKTGQPILVGTTTIEDSEYLSGLLDRKGVEHKVLNAKYHEKEASIVSQAGQKDAVTVATNMAGRGTDIPLGDGVKDLGGLYVLGTERHEARRIDNQLRGRSGRQGDPGKSQFFVALDDEIMRIQGGETIKKIMELTNLPADIPIESPLVSRAIENAQKKMEGYHFDIRKRVVDYDNVMNQQREIFYTKRLNIIRVCDLSAAEEGEKSDMAREAIVGRILELLNERVEYIVAKNYKDSEQKELDVNNIKNEVLDLADDEYIKSTVEASDYFKGIGITTLNKLFEKQNDLESNLKKLVEEMLNKKVAEFGHAISEIYKITALQTMDDLWTEHLESINDLREGIGLRGYAQRDPLVEYKNEAFGLFETFMGNINSQISKRILKIRRVISPLVSPVKINTNESEIVDVITGSHEIDGGGSSTRPRRIINGQASSDISKAPVGRNDVCPCGSGLKYKKCGLINSPEHLKRISK